MILFYFPFEITTSCDTLDDTSVNEFAMPHKPFHRVNANEDGQVKDSISQQNALQT